MPKTIHNVPTNIISGFLGVGKTTAILNLFANKPATEKWAVLVNEFGKVGIDGRVYKANGIEVKEIPGGCMCCAQGLPLQVAVNRLLRETEPDRLIIESSGVGHPAGVLKTLKGDGFNEVLSLKAGICLLDARHLLEAKYQNNELFKEQLQHSDVLIANKADLAPAEALQAFFSFAESFSPAKEFVATCTNGQFDIALLDYSHIAYSQRAAFKLHPVAKSHTRTLESHSFIFPADTLFDLGALKQWLSTMDFIRLKGLIQTTDGCYLLNHTNGTVDVSKIDNQTDNHIEVINYSLDIVDLEQKLNKFVIDRG